jgi:hypothetical protein
MALVRILMSKSGFKDKVLIKLIVGVVRREACHTINDGRVGRFYILSLATLSVDT